MCPAPPARAGGQAERPAGACCGQAVACVCIERLDDTRSGATYGDLTSHSGVLEILLRALVPSDLCAFRSKKRPERLASLALLPECSLYIRDHHLDCLAFDGDRARHRKRARSRCSLTKQQLEARKQVSASCPD